MTFGPPSRGSHGHETLRGLTATLVIASRCEGGDHVDADPWRQRGNGNGAHLPRRQPDALPENVEVKRLDSI